MGASGMKKHFAGTLILLLAVVISGCGLGGGTDTVTNGLNVYDIEETETVTTTTRAYNIDAETTDTAPRPAPVEPTDEAIRANVRFYVEPTDENLEPAIMGELRLPNAEAERLVDIINGVDEWKDDHLVDRVTFFFDGEIVFSHSDRVYYFECQYNNIYYDHYFGQISVEDMEYIKGLAKRFEGADDTVENAAEDTSCGDDII